MVWGLDGRESLLTDSDLSEPSDPIPLDSLETDGLGLVCDCESPAMSMICPNELNELKLSVSNPARGSATLKAMSANGKSLLYCNYTCKTPLRWTLLAMLTESNAPIFYGHFTCTERTTHLWLVYESEIAKQHCIQWVKQ